MLSYPDFKEKQILFVEAQEGKRLEFHNDNVVVKWNRETVSQVSCHRIFCVFIIGDTSFTTYLIKKALKFGISFIFMRQNFEPFAIIGAATEGNYVLRIKQYSFTGALPVARHLVSNKVQNQILLLKSIRDKTKELKEVIKQCETIEEKILTAESNDSLLGLEGSVSKLFFQTYFADIGWHKRLPRTKYDIPNTLLDIGYTFLFNLIDAHLRLYGFDPYMGVYHQLFYDRKSLVCDLVEPFRCIIDAAILRAFHLGQVNPKDFTIHQDQYQLDFQHAQKYTRIFFEQLIKHKEAIFRYVQAYYRAIMQDSHEFPVFTIKD